MCLYNVDIKGAHKGFTVAHKGFTVAHKGGLNIVFYTIFKYICLYNCPKGLYRIKY
jgi:hypothetical protein